MVNQQLINYIKSAEAQGYNSQQLFNYLVQQGYNPNDVNEAIKLAGPQAGKPATPQAAKPATPGLKLAIDPHMIMITVLTVLALGGAVFFVFFMPVCGDGEVERGETVETCCLDAGCIGDQVCMDNTCEEPICGACQYLENHYCIGYECCQNSQCQETQECIDKACVNLPCTDCQYAENHKCNDYLCCKDEDCNDNGIGTIGICENPGTKEAECSTVANECENDADCNDRVASTKDTCSGTPKVCFNTEITECIAGDVYCPLNCTPETDSDCAAGDECAMDSDCDDSDSSTYDLCKGSPKKCYYEVQDCNLTLPNNCPQMLINLVETCGMSAEGYKGSAYDVTWSVDKPEMASVRDDKGSRNWLTSYDIPGIVEVTAKDESVSYVCEASIEIEIVESLD